MAMAAGIFSALGSVVSGVLGFEQMQYQAQVAKMNESIAKDNAVRAVQRSQINQEEQDQKSLALLGAQESAQAESGVSLTSPSFVRTRKSAMILARKDALNVRQAGEIEAYNYKTQAANFGAEANAAEFGAFGNLLGTFLSLPGSLLSLAKPTAMAGSFGPYPVQKPLLSRGAYG